MQKKIVAMALILVSLSIVSVFVHPQSADENSYLIEIIVFKNVGPDTSDNELWGRDTDIELNQPVSTDHSAAHDSMVRFVYKRTLGNLAAEIQASGRYELLKRMAWVQAASSKSEAPTVSIESGNVLAGTLRFYEKQLLFIELDLRFNRPLTSIPGTTVPYSAHVYRTPDFTIKQTRRVKINEIHYFDHPYFGALVKASRWSQTP